MTDWVQKQLERIHGETGEKGGPGSGHHGHAGRPGKRGGSVPGQNGGGGGEAGRPESDDYESSLPTPEEDPWLYDPYADIEEWSYGRVGGRAVDVLRRRGFNANSVTGKVVIVTDPKEKAEEITRLFDRAKMKKSTVPGKFDAVFSLGKLNRRILRGLLMEDYRKDNPDLFPNG